MSDTRNVDVKRPVAMVTDLQRDLGSLANLGGYTHSQIAALLEIPLGTVKTRILDGLLGMRMTISTS